MNGRPLTAGESTNLAVLNSAGFSSTLLFITATGLQKAILDATQPMRTMLVTSGIHDYSLQAKGPEFKVTKHAVMWDALKARPVDVSLYRPITKNGDPRLWIYGLKDVANADDVVAIFIVGNVIQVLNLTRTNVVEALHTNQALLALISRERSGSKKTSQELLAKLENLAARGPIKAVCKGDTAVGMSIEQALGIPPNSSRRPDYKGIELKAGRSNLAGRATRATLFACVPDWSISTFKSSAEILDTFGYQRELQFKLYCTVATTKANSQGLQFRIIDSEQLLHEHATQKCIGGVAVWRFPALEQRLREKHRETFWIKAVPEIRNGTEWFHLKSVLHTRNPNIPQFERLLAEGSITMDHLIKRTPAGGAAEKGPLFKIVRNRIPELFFGEPTTYTFE